MSMQIFGTRFQLSLGEVRFTIGFTIDAQQAEEGQGKAS